MSVKTDAALTTQAQIIRDETAPEGNTRVRIYQMYKDIIDSKGNTGLGSPMSLMPDFDLSLNLFPVIGSAADGTVRRGDTYDISVGGAPQGADIPALSTIRAKIDAPGQTLANWRIMY